MDEIQTFQFDKDPTVRELHIGSMKVPKPQFKALLVFMKEDAQLQALEKTLGKLAFEHDVTSCEAALDAFHKKQPHLVIIDCRHNYAFDAETVCSSIRNTSNGSFTTIVALVHRRYRAVHTPSVKLPCFLNCDFYKRNQINQASNTTDLLNVGFNRFMNETTKLDELEDELLQLESGLLTQQVKIKSCQAILTALERCRDLIWIIDDKSNIQYVNKTLERVLGFQSKHVVGTNFSQYIQNDKSNDDVWEKIQAEIQAEKEWEGSFYCRRKIGDDVHLQAMFLPLCEQDRSNRQYVVLCYPHSQGATVPDISQFISIKRKNSYEFHRRHSGAAEQLQIRRLSAASSFEGDGSHRRTNSLAKIHSMAIEAPITQIINLINVVKDCSQPSETEVLEQILEILRNSELYSPADLPNKSRDPMLSDFVEGLVTGTGFSHRRSSGGENILSRTGKGALARTNENPAIAMCLENYDSWDYDVLALERVSVKKPLVHSGMHALGQFNVCEVLDCSPTTLHSWLVAIEQNYHASNPYHNSTHAADVLHATAYFLKKDRLKNWMEPLDEIAALLAAIIHDVDHPGRTNNFLVNSSSPLALLYNDTAVLESHHAAFAFKFTVNNDKCNIFKNLSKENFMTIRQSIIDMVLATELSKHFEHVNKFISIVTKNNSNNPDSETTSGSTGRATSGQNAAVTHELKTLIKRVMIKVADVINPARKTPLCVEWARRISEEYFAQTDEEKRLGLPVVMPHFDRNTCSMPKSQMTFMDYFLTDMFEAWHEFCGMEDVMNNLTDNYNYWKKLQDRGVMRLAELEDEEFADLHYDPTVSGRHWKFPDEKKDSEIPDSDSIINKTGTIGNHLPH
ncbi:high affinity cAMP-specific and IBMX-insensitive 3',5'-cyclic phosphodiesterase 8A isoform X2 [Ciona intestinalis]